MTDSPSQLALRQWREAYLAPPALIGMAAATAVMVLVGPFGSDIRLNLLERLIYWAPLCFGGYAAGLGASLWVMHRFAHWSFVAQVILAGGLCALAVLVGTTTLNYIMLDWWPSLDEWPVFAATVAGIALIVNTAMIYGSRANAPDSDAGLQEAAPMILDRLPLEKRGPLVSISVEDHYVRVRTTKGEDLILLRLSDAMRETGATRGAQVHRSHWVAFDHVRKVDRVGDRAVLSMSAGPEIPCSRANIAKLKEAGLLPR